MKSSRLLKVFEEYIKTIDMNNAYNEYRKSSGQTHEEMIEKAEKLMNVELDTIKDSAERKFAETLQSLEFTAWSSGVSEPEGRQQPHRRHDCHRRHKLSGSAAWYALPLYD